MTLIYTAFCCALKQPEIWDRRRSMVTIVQRICRDMDLHIKNWSADRGL